MTCLPCEEFRRKYPLQKNDEGELVHDLGENTFSSPIECAFSSSESFSTSNWCCQTMLRLRELAEGNTFWHEDSNLGIIRIPACDIGVQQGILVLSWYKSRGRTGRAWIFWDDDEPVILNLKTAEFILARAQP
jgi:hypothetical protein